ncbi:MAG: hypothetical protein HJJLKODD_01714 [Phycisphaerae bacterium]|nr:hypothetical protein [Phycisphaerae bacterium]
MRIAVASDDGRRIAAHTGRCAGFVIYDVQGNAPQRVEYRQNRYTAHAQGECDGAHDHGGDAHHSHGPLVAALADCRVLITRGLGPRLVADLAVHNIEAYVCNVTDADEAAGQYTAGQLLRVQGTGCGHHC